MKSMFLSTRGILNTPWTFLKRSSFLCTGCRCRPPCVGIITVCPKIIIKIFTCRGCSSHYTPGWGSPGTWDCTRCGKLQKLNSRPGNKGITQKKNVVPIIFTAVFESSGWLCSGMWWVISGSNDADDEDDTKGVRDADFGPAVVWKALSRSLTLCFWCLGHPSWLYFIFPSSPPQWPPGVQTPSTIFRILRVTYHRRRIFFSIFEVIRLKYLSWSELSLF